MEPSSDVLAPHFVRRLERLTLRARRLYLGRGMGEKRSSRRGAGLEFSSHRPYVSGDDLRHLDWALLGRLGRPFLKTYEEEQDLPIHLLVDTSQSMGFGGGGFDPGSAGSAGAEDPPTKLLAALRLAAALAHIALSSLDRVGAAFYDDRGLKLHPPARGKSALLPLLRFLAQAEAQGGAPTSALRLHAAVSRPGLSLVLSDFLDPHFETTLRPHLHRRHTLVLIQILSPEELDPPFEGDVELVDSESGESLPTTLGIREHEAYRRRLAEHCEELRRFGMRHGAEVFSLRSDLPLEEAVWGHLLGGMFLGRG